MVGRLEEVAMDINVNRSAWSVQPRAAESALDAVAVLLSSSVINSIRHVSNTQLQISGNQLVADVQYCMDRWIYGFDLAAVECMRRWFPIIHTGEGPSEVAVRFHVSLQVLSFVQTVLDTRSDTTSTPLLGDISVHIHTCTHTRLE
jgi:hypothetical protein